MTLELYLFNKKQKHTVSCIKSDFCFQLKSFICKGFQSTAQLIYADCNCIAICFCRVDSGVS